MKLETKRLILRYIEKSDLAPLVELWTDPKVTKYMGGSRDAKWLTAELEKDVEDPQKEEFNLWPLVEKSTNNVIGHCGLLSKEIENNVEIEVIYVLAESAWGQGYAGEIAKLLIDYAFKQYKNQRVVALLDKENAASEVVAKKIGMSYIKDVKRDNGKTMLLYAINNYLKEN